MTQAFSLALSVGVLLVERVVDDDDEVLAPDLLKPVGAAGTRQYRGTWPDVDILSIQRHHAPTAEKIVDLVFGLLVVADARTRPEDALPEHETELRNGAEE